MPVLHFLTWNLRKCRGPEESKELESHINTHQFLEPRSMSWIGLLCLFPLFLIGSSSNEKQPSAYEALRQYDFPVGLLPQGATGYDLNRFTGKFTAYLNDTCNFSLTNLYELRYKTTISGVISKDHLKKLKGVSVKVLEVWLNIVEVKRDGDHLQFSVGIVSAKFPVSSFEESPQCGCGFKCGTGESRKSRFNLFVSSSQFAHGSLADSI